MTDPQHEIPKNRLEMAPDAIDAVLVNFFNQIEALGLDPADLELMLREVSEILTEKFRRQEILDLRERTTEYVEILVEPSAGNIDEPDKENESVAAEVWGLLENLCDKLDLQPAKARELYSVLLCTSTLLKNIK